jgi:hypothetical protein
MKKNCTTFLFWRLLLVLVVSGSRIANAQFTRIQWQKSIELTYSNTELQSKVKLVNAASGGFGVLTASIGTLVRLTETGDVVWQKQVETANSQFYSVLEATALTALPDDGFAVVVRDATGWALTRVNAAGNTVWKKKLDDYPGYGLSNVIWNRNTLIYTADKGFLTSYNLSSPRSAGQTVVQKFDDNGNLLWTKSLRYPYPNGVRDITSVDNVIETNEGDYILVGRTVGDLSGPAERGYAVRLNKAGNVLWERRYEERAYLKDVVKHPYLNGHFIFSGGDINFADVTNTLIVRPDGAWITGGYSHSDNVNKDVFVTAGPGSNYAILDGVTQNGNDVRLTGITSSDKSSTQTFGGSGNDQARAIVTTNDGGYVIAGTTTSTDGDVQRGSPRGALATWIVKVVPPITLQVSVKSYDCASGFIVFETSEGNGSPVTFTVPGVTRTSPSSTTGIVEQGLRNDPRPLVITASQSGQSIYTTFDFSAYCRENLAPKLIKPIPNQTLTVDKSLSIWDGGLIDISSYFQKPGDSKSFRPIMRFRADGLPVGLYLDGYANEGNLVSYIAGTPTKTGVFDVTITAYIANDPKEPSVSTTFRITVVGPNTGNVLTVSPPVYNCTTGDITLLTNGGDGSPVVFTAPGITRLSPTSNVGIVERELRGDPAPIKIQATQSGYTASYTFDFKAFCLARQPSPIGSVIEDRTLRVVDVIVYPNFIIGQGYYNASDPNNYKKWPIAATGLPSGLSLSTSVISGTLFVVEIAGVATTPGVYPVTVTAQNPLFPNDPPYVTRFTITVVGSTTNALTLLAPTYDCATGAIRFNTSGGDGTAIEFQSPGITSWTTNPNQFVDKDSRTANDVQPFTLTARQSGRVVTYTWDLKAACGRSARTAAVEAVAKLNVRVLGNPVGDEAVVEITGVEGQAVQLQLVNNRGTVLETRSVATAGSAERLTFDVGRHATTMLLLQATAGQQSQTVKLIKTK